MEKNTTTQIVLMGTCGACGEEAAKFISSGVWVHTSPGGCPAAHRKPDPRAPAVFIPGPPNKSVLESCQLDYLEDKAG